MNTGNTVNCTSAKGETGFEVSSFSVGGSDAVNPISKGSGAGKPSLANLVLTKQFDACSEQLIKAFLTATSLPTVTVTQVRATPSGPAVPIMVITLTNAFLINYQLSSGGGTLYPTEALSFAYSGICISSTTLTAQGTAGQTTKVCYNALTNQVM